MNAVQIMMNPALFPATSGGGAGLVSASAPAGLPCFEQMFVQATAAAGMAELQLQTMNASLPAAVKAVGGGAVLSSGVFPPVHEADGRESSEAGGAAGVPRGMDAAAAVETLLAGMKERNGQIADMHDSGRRKGAEKKGASLRASSGTPMQAFLSTNGEEPSAGIPVPEGNRAGTNNGRVSESPAATDSGSARDGRGNPEAVSADPAVLLSSFSMDQGILTSVAKTPEMETVRGGAPAPQQVVVEKSERTTVRDPGPIVGARGQEVAAAPRAEVPHGVEQHQEAAASTGKMPETEAVHGGAPASQQVVVEKSERTTVCDPGPIVGARGQEDAAAPRVEVPHGVEQHQEAAASAGKMPETEAVQGVAPASQQVVVEKSEKTTVRDPGPIVGARGQEVAAAPRVERPHSVEQHQEAAASAGKMPETETVQGAASAGKMPEIETVQGGAPAPQQVVVEKSERTTVRDPGPIVGIKGQEVAAAPRVEVPHGVEQHQEAAASAGKMPEIEAVKGGAPAPQQVVVEKSEKTTVRDPGPIVGARGQEVAAAPRAEVPHGVEQHQEAAASAGKMPETETVQGAASAGKMPEIEAVQGGAPAPQQVVVEKSERTTVRDPGPIVGARGQEVAAAPRMERPHGVEQHQETAASAGKMPETEAVQGGAPAPQQVVVEKSEKTTVRDPGPIVGARGQEVAAAPRAERPHGVEQHQEAAASAGKMPETETVQGAASAGKMPETETVQGGAPAPQQVVVEKSERTTVRDPGPIVGARGQEVAAAPRVEEPHGVEQHQEAAASAGKMPETDNASGPGPATAHVAREKSPSEVVVPKAETGTGEYGVSGEVPVVGKDRVPTVASAEPPKAEPSGSSETKPGSETVVRGSGITAETAEAAARVRPRTWETGTEGREEADFRAVPGGNTPIGAAQTAASGRKAVPGKEASVTSELDPSAAVSSGERKTTPRTGSDDHPAETMEVAAGKSGHVSPGESAMGQNGTGTGGENRPGMENILHTTRLGSETGEATDVRPATQTAPEKSSLHESIITQVREKIAAHDPATGAGQITLKLNPRELGDLQIHLRMEDQRVCVEVTAANPVVKEALLQNLDQLKDTLSRQNIVVEKFDVSAGGGQGTDQSFREGRQAAYRRYEAPEYASSLYYTAESGENRPSFWEPRENSLVDLRL